MEGKRLPHLGERVSERKIRVLSENVKEGFNRQA